MNQIFRTPASLALVILFALLLGSCSQENAANAGSAANGSPAPLSELDGAINEYEKVANEFVRVSRKLKEGDLSVTLRVIELEQRIRESGAKVQQESPKMTPPQAQRVASISSKTAPYLQP